MTKNWNIYFIHFYEMLVLSTKWTKISLKRDFHLYYVGSSDGVILFCWGAWSFLLFKLVLQCWAKLLHVWKVSILSRSVPGLVKYCSVTFYCPILYTCLEVGRLFVVLSPVYVLLLLSLVVYIDRLFSNFECFDFVKVFEFLYPF